MTDAPIEDRRAPDGEPQLQSLAEAEAAGRLPAEDRRTDAERAAEDAGAKLHGYELEPDIQWEQPETIAAPVDGPFASDEKGPELTPVSELTGKLGALRESVIGRLVAPLIPEGSEAHELAQKIAPGYARESEAPAVETEPLTVIKAANVRRIHELLDGISAPEASIVGSIRNLLPTVG